MIEDFNSNENSLGSQEIDIEEASQVLFTNIFSETISKVKDSQLSVNNEVFITSEQFVSAIEAFHHAQIRSGDADSQTSEELRDLND